MGDNMKLPDFWLTPHSTVDEAALDLCLELKKQFSFKEIQSILLTSIAILLDNPELPDDTADILKAMVSAGAREATKNV
jgi:hypothetical protein